MEIWDVYDKDRNFTGKVISRNGKQDLKKGEYGLVAHVAIFNDKNEMLIQKRQASKQKFPNLWDITAGGHSISGETSQETIERELWEELGYRHDFSDVRSHLTVNSERDFGDVYIINDVDIDLNDLKIQVEEVQSVTWATKEEILQLIEEKKFINYCPGFIELLFFMKEIRGVMIR